MQPPTETGEDKPTENSDSNDAASAITEDHEVAEWVKKQTKLREEGTLHISEKPALHAVALDQVGSSSSGADAPTPQND